MRAIVTGGAGFIGSHLVTALIKDYQAQVATIDKLTYAGHRINLTDVLTDPKHQFINLDILHYHQVTQVFRKFKPDTVFHLAAESHVDRSIDSSRNFIETNVLGTNFILEAALNYWKNNASAKNFKFIYLSTDEVFGSIASGKFNENSKYQPNSPYAASKAAGDMLVNSFHKTYSLPTIIANSSNNYGPRQYPEKLIPLCILNALENKPIPIYGDGQQIRDWIYVTDHVAALIALAHRGQAGQSYCIGANCEKTNREIVTNICKILDDIKPRVDKTSYESLITFVQDRPAHDRRYAIDASKIYKELNWDITCNFTEGLRRTVLWYYKNQNWVNTVTDSQTRVRRGLNLKSAGGTI